jgi:hypothetical protein
MLNDLLSYYEEAITSCSYLDVLAFAAHLYQHNTGVLSHILLVGVSVFAWAFSHKRASAIADIATSRIRSAAQGYLELYGRVSVNPENLIKSPLSGIAYIWLRYKGYSKDNHDREWREVSSGVSNTTF